MLVVIRKPGELPFGKAALPPRGDRWSATMSRNMATWTICRYNDMDVNMNGGILHLLDFTNHYFGQNWPLKLALILFLPKIRFGPLVAHKLSQGS